MKKVKLFNIDVNTGPYLEFVQLIVNSAKARTRGYTCVANVHMLVTAQGDKGFANDVKNANIITPDGKPLAWALRLLYGIRQDRVAGMDLVPDLLRAAEEQNVRVYFYGGTQFMLNKTRQYINEKYPDLAIAGMYSPPFGSNFSEMEEEFAVQHINSTDAGLVFVILGCPKQEKWMASMRGRINALTIGIGAALPVLIGIQKRAPKWMQDAGLEWLFRLIQEPRRLTKRYTVTNTIFIFLLLRQYLKMKFRKYKKKMSKAIHQPQVSKANGAKEHGETRFAKGAKPPLEKSVAEECDATMTP